jgi:hypothetical protein
MHNLTMIPSEVGPERPQVHLELIESQGPNALQKRIEMVKEPTPNLPRSHPMLRRGVGADSLVDGWEIRKVGDRDRVLGGQVRHATGPRV